MLATNLVRDTGYTSEVFRGFLQTVRANDEIIPQF